MNILKFLQNEDGMEKMSDEIAQKKPNQWLVF